MTSRSASSSDAKIGIGFFIGGRFYSMHEAGADRAQMTFAATPPQWEHKGTSIDRRRQAYCAKALFGARTVVVGQDDDGCVEDAFDDLDRSAIAFGFSRFCLDPGRNRRGSGRQTQANACHFVTTIIRRLQQR